MKTSRNESVSIAKGIGILLMVLGHSGCPAVVSNFLSFYHMPLFFFLSGYFFKIGFRDNYKTYIISKFKSLWYPFVKWSLVFLVLHNVLYYCCLEPDLLSWKESLVRFVEIPFMFGNDQLLGGYWFLNDLFYVTILSTFFFMVCYFINKNSTPTILLTLFATLSFALFVVFIGISDSSTNKVYILLAKYSYSLTTFVCGTVVATFFSCQHSAWLKNTFNRMIYSWMSILFAFIGILLGALFLPASRSSIGTLSIGMGVYMFFMALVGVYMTCAVARIIKFIAPTWLKRFFVFVGNNTLIILTWHFLAFKIVSLTYVLTLSLPLRMIDEHPTIHAFSNNGGWVLYFIIGTLVPILIAATKQNWKGKVCVNNMSVK